MDDFDVLFLCWKSSQGVQSGKVTVETKSPILLRKARFPKVVVACAIFSSDNFHKLVLPVEFCSPILKGDESRERRISLWQAIGNFRHLYYPFHNSKSTGYTNGCRCCRCSGYCSVGGLASSATDLINEKAS